MRRLALPTSVGLIETSGGQEDVQSFAWDAAVNLRAALTPLPGPWLPPRRSRLSRAASLAGPPWPPAAEALLDRLGPLVKPIDGDRQFGADIELLLSGHGAEQLDT